MCSLYLDMTDPNADCPDGWNMTDYFRRTCGRASDQYDTCDSVTFPISGGEYRQDQSLSVGQWGRTAAFHYKSMTLTLDDAYFRWLPDIDLYTLYSDDPLWDGSDCHSNSTCCSLHDPPYFTKSLNTTTTDDNELRLCLLRGLHRMNIAVEFI